MEKYAAIKAELETRRAELAERVAANVAELTHPLDQDSEEQAVDLADDDVLEEVADVESREIAQIDAALARIEAGTYGECANCGCEIPEARLKALPWATRCINCAA